MPRIIANWGGGGKRCITYRTILSSLSSLSSEISRMAVLGTPSSSASSRIFLSATIWFVLTSRALYTTPYVPVVCVCVCVCVHVCACDNHITTIPSVTPSATLALDMKSRVTRRRTHLRLYVQCEQLCGGKRQKKTRTHRLSLS